MFESKLNKGKANGYAPLGNDSRVPIQNSQPDISGITYSAGTITFNKTDGSSLEVTGFFTESDDIFVTGGTYASNTGVATFTNNSGGTFNVSGFFTDSNLNNFTRVLNICEDDLIGTGTTEQKILDYLLLTNYKKQTYDGEVDIIVDKCGPAQMSLNVTVYAGSIIVIFDLETNRPITQDITLPVELILYFNDDSSTTIQSDVTILKGKLSGSNIFTNTALNYEDLSKTYTINLSGLSLNYDANIASNLSFGGYVSGIGNDWNNGIGIDLLN